MKTKIHNLIARLAVLGLCALHSALSTSYAQGTAFTYQGHLNNNASPANGTYNLTFSLFHINTGGSAAAGPVTINGVTVTNGLFTAQVDFGSGVFNGQTAWLEIGVETNGGSSFTTLAPRAQVAPAPYAIYAETANAAGLVGNIPAADLSGTYGDAVTFNNAANTFNGIFDGNGAGLANVNAATLNGYDYCSLPCYWNLTGNAGTTPGVNFLGTTDNEPLELRVNNITVMRFDYNTTAPNITGGYLSQIDPAAEGSTIGGGTGNMIVASAGYSTIGGGVYNVITPSGTGFDGCAFIGGGGNGSVSIGPRGFTNNLASGFFSTIGAGRDNTAAGRGASILGGEYNSALGDGAFVGGGTQGFIGFPNNTAGGTNSVVAGGLTNMALGNYSTIPGGAYNVAQGDYSFAAGQQAQAAYPGDFVWADSQNAPFTSSANDQFLIRAQGGVAINTNNPNGSMLYVTGSETSSPFAFKTPVAYIQNTYTGADSSPALVLVGNGASSSGVLSVSALGTGLIAEFGNANQFVSTLDANGNWTGKTFNPTSDRNAKEHFTAVDPRSVLERVAALPITEWNFKTENSIQHLGPMAQDFRAAFNLGMDDKHIATVDEEGVALAAIQGLNQKVDEKDAEIQELKQSVADLKKLVQSLANKK